MHSTDLENEPIKYDVRDQGGTSFPRVMATDLFMLSAASSSLPGNGDLHFSSKQSHGGGHQHQVGQTFLHYHSGNICPLGWITRLL